jgi:hypothetical protein
MTKKILTDVEIDGTLSLNGSSVTALVTSGTFTTASAFSVDNCFTSAHDDYLIVFTFTGGSADGREPLFRLRASSADASGSADYVHGIFTWESATGPTKSVGKESRLYLNAFNSPALPVPLPPGTT